MKNQLKQNGIGLSQTIDGYAARFAQETATATHDYAEFGFRKFSEACLNKVHSLKEKLTANLAADYGGWLSLETVRQAVNEADSLASFTPFPALFLPELAQEKARTASEWQARQHFIQYRTQAFAA